MTKKICYMGDIRLMGAASYLAGIMTHAGLAFDYVPSDQPPPSGLASDPYSLYVVSDYPVARFGASAMNDVAGSVERGAGLVMIGGWESFFGCAGEYHHSPLAKVLPVVMQQADDRRNFAQPCLINKTADHPILEGLPWDQPPGIGGLNAITAKPNAQTLLTAVRFSARQAGGQFQFTRGDEIPLLVVGQYGRGRTAALATDVAPHWVGGLVDWGDQRVIQDVAGGFTIDVGNWYARFFRNLLVWAAQF
jgi:hypothetical protein